MSTRSDRRAVAPSRATALAGVLALLAVLIAPTSLTAAAAPSTEADDALDWLAAELDANAGTLPAFSPGSTDWGLTADAVLAFTSAGRGDDSAAQTATDLVIDNVDAFTTWDDLGPDYAGVRQSGQLGKVLLVAETQGRDTSDIGGTDLEAELRSLMRTTAPEIGRFADRNPYGADTSNGFGQTLSMLALSYTDAGVPAATVSYLLEQQCPGGGFRLFFTTTDGCVSANDADPDTTALAVQALLVTERTTTVEVALSTAVGYLLAAQDPTSGGFGGSGPTSSINANSTGLVGQTLRAVGQVAAADRAAGWVTTDLQLTTANTSSSPAAVDVGAIAYSPSTRSDAITTGIEQFARDQWRRATSQAVLALGSTRYGPPGTDVPVDPPTSSTTTTVTSTSTTTPVPTSTTAPVSTSSTPTSTTNVTPTTEGTPPGVLDATSGRSGPSAGATSATGGGSTGSTTSTARLAATGVAAGSLITIGLVLLVAGLGTMTIRRREA